MSKPIFSIYKIMNLLSGKIYIGKSQSPTALGRWKYHISADRATSTCHIHNAIVKYGSENFSFEVIYNTFDGDKKYLGKMEKFFIEEYDSLKSGYNMTIGGDGGATPGCERNLGKYSQVGGCSGKNNPFYNKKHSDVTLEVLRRHAKNREMKECKCGAKVDPANYAKWHGDNCGKKVTQPPRTKEYCENASIRMLGRNIGKKIYYNPQNPVEVRQLYPNECPSGWLHGSPRHKSIIRPKGMKWCYDPNNEGRTTMCFPEDIPEGWLFGNPKNKGGKTISGRKWYHNPNDNKSRAFNEDSVPDGWVPGRVKETRKRKPR